MIANALTDLLDNYVWRVISLAVLKEKLNCCLDIAETYMVPTTKHASAVNTKK